MLLKTTYLKVVYCRETRATYQELNKRTFNSIFAIFIERRPIVNGIRDDDQSYSVKRWKDGRKTI